MASKIKAISGAYTRLRISGITVQPTAAHVTRALTRMEQMLAEWEENKNLCLGYNFEDNPDANSEMGVSLGTENMIEANLAVRMAPDFNKVLPQELKNDAKRSYCSVSARVAVGNLRDVRPPNRMAVGSGHRYRERVQRYNHFEKLPPIGCPTKKMNIDEIDNFVEHYDSYLTGETITSFTIEQTGGLVIVSSSNTDSDINYTVQAKDPPNQRIGQAIIITMITSGNRVEIRKINFEIVKQVLLDEFG